VTSVIVVGAGIVGACVTYELARAGAEVTLVEREPTPGAGATAASFAWIGDGPDGHWPGRAADLRPHILADHHRLAAEVPAIPYRWCGSLSWPAEPGADTIDAGQIARLEPHLRDVPEHAVHSPADGAVDATGMAVALVEAAERLGARVLMGTTATATAARSVTTDRGRLDADAVVLTTGAALTEVSPAVLVRASAPPGLVRSIVSAPGFEVREGRPGELLFAAVAGSDPETVVARFRAAFSGAEGVRLLSSAVGSRPMPPQGPVIGYAGNGTFHAVMHSAVCLAPTAARVVAEEIRTVHPNG
jgi:glycine/D-amino acid oxidase-like deaminating enzyme